MVGGDFRFLLLGVFSLKVHGWSTVAGMFEWALVLTG